MATYAVLISDNITAINTVPGCHAVCKCRNCGNILFGLALQSSLCLLMLDGS